MKIALKRPQKRPDRLAGVLTPPENKNAGTALLDSGKTLRLFPKLIKVDQNDRFYAPTFEIEDFLLACRYLYYVKHTQIISDKMYDEFEEVFLKYNPESILKNPGSDKQEDYPAYAIALGMYFIFKLTQKEKPKARVRLIKGK